MLRNIKELENSEISATDGSVGHVKDFYFDDQAWAIRYLVVETGIWLSSRKVLISPISIHDPNWTEKRVPVSITQEQVKHSPNIDTDKPVSRQHEMQYLDYYNYPYYWGGLGFWGGELYPYAMLPGYAGIGSHRAESLGAGNAAEERAEKETHLHDNPHLRSFNEVLGYHIHATDGEIGHVEGMLLDEKTWAIQYFIVNTSNWWIGHQVLISPKWITDVRWSDGGISVDLSRESVKGAPPYNSTEELNRDRESELYEHYGRTGYWKSDVEHEAESDTPPRST